MRSERLVNSFQANICLLAVTLCWSCEVILLSALPEGMNPFAMTCSTSTIGAVLLGACFIRRIVASFRRDGLKIVQRIFLLSVLNASYNVLVEMGLDYFDVSTGAFTVSMVVVVLPVMLLIMHRGVSARTWISALLVLAGIASVAITPSIIAGCAFIVLGNIVETLPIDRLKKKLSIGKSAEAVDALDADTPPEDGAIEEKAAVRENAIDGSSTADLVTRVLVRLGHPFVRNIALFLLLLAVYLVISLPFKVISVIPGFSDIRPVCMLQPVYGIFFGLPGCFAFGIGNLISDILSDSLRWTSIAGLIGNFAFPFLMYLYWNKLRKKPFSLRTGRSVLDMAGSILFCSCIQSLIICPAVAIVYPEVDIVVFTVSVIANTTLFSLAFAIPFIMLLQEELGFEPLFFEKFAKSGNPALSDGETS